ncbi:MAG: hypothetical protein D6690_11635 [Nitrospirae bacterium]|nr:MAG: hypothetical protein D6690_11635 [Nitrospirota bacterium]
MTESRAFWSVEHEQGQPDLFVCMKCLSEVFRSQLPAEGCPTCGSFSSYEAFTLEDIQQWGTEELIHKAQRLSVTCSRSENETSPSSEIEESPS